MFADDAVFVRETRSIETTYKWTWRGRSVGWVHGHHNNFHVMKINTEKNTDGDCLGAESQFEESASDRISWIDILLSLSLGRCINYILVNVQIALKYIVKEFF